MISGKYAKYYKGQPVKDLSKRGGNITPLEFRRIGKPIVFMDITLTEEYLRQPEDKSKPVERLPSD